MDWAELDRHRCELIKASELWQFDLMNPQKLVQFARDRDVEIFGGSTIEDLWRVGLLRADAVTSSREIDTPPLTLVAEEKGTFFYGDTRPVPYRPEGYGGVLSRDRPDLKDIELHFHPFRLYVLHHIDRVFSSTTASIQYLLNPDGFAKLTESEIEFLNRWTSGDQFAPRFEHWNRIAELAIVLEPTAYGRVFNSIRWRSPDTQESIEKKLAVRREQHKSLLGNVTPKEINKLRQDLCQDAESLDHNKMVHVLLRLITRRERLNMRSSLGACMLLKGMAEIIRRAFEEATQKQLSEEDELGFGQWMKGARKMIYGTERILDATPEERRDFLRSMGIDFGIKARAYLEGETEFGAMDSAAGEGAGVELINLRGQFIESKGKGLAFIESLKKDMKSHVFSIVLLDGDRIDNVRALRKAVQDGNFFGRFFISDPDFEFGNFTVQELVDVLLKLAARDFAELPSRDDLLTQVGSAKSGKAFFHAVADDRLQRIGKSTDWGAALMAHAISHPEFPEGHGRAGQTRKIIEAAQVLMRTRDAGYLRSLEQFRVDPETGELREK